MDGDTLQNKKSKLEEYLTAVAEDMEQVIVDDSTYTGFNSVIKIDHDISVGSDISVTTGSMKDVCSKCGGTNMIIRRTRGPYTSYKCKACKNEVLIHMYTGEIKP